MNKILHLRILKLYGDMRQFKSAKRQELKALKRAHSDLRTACAHSPAYEEIFAIGQLIKSIEAKQSVKEWGQ